MISMGEYKTKESQRRIRWKHYTTISPKKQDSSREKEITPYRRTGEQLLSPKEGWYKIKWNLYAKVQGREKQTSSWEEGLNSFSKGEWVVSGFQRGMMQDKVKLVCQGATPWKTGNFLKGRVDFFTGGRLTRCWAPKRNESGQSEISMSR